MFNSKKKKLPKKEEELKTEKYRNENLQKKE